MNKNHSSLVAALALVALTSTGVGGAEDRQPTAAPVAPANTAPVPAASASPAAAGESPAAAPDTGPSAGQEQQPELPGLRGILAVPVQQEPDSSSLDRSKGQMWRRLTMRITGSMCPACLMELEGKIKQMPGVVFVKIERAAPLAPPPVAAAGQAASTDKNQHHHGSQPRSVATVIVFDGKEMSSDALNQLIKRELYKPMDVKEADK